MDQVLDDELADGILQVEARLRPARLARTIAADGWDAADADVRLTCQLWGGAADLLVPVHGTEVAEPYEYLLDVSELDAVTGVPGP